MFQRVGRLSIPVTITLLVLHSSSGYLEECNKIKSCGWKSICENGTCSCLDGYQLHQNGKDCANETCKPEDCLECTTSQKCSRCVGFIEENALECVKSCNGEAKMVTSGKLRGSVCTSSEGMSQLWIGLTAGISAGLVLCVIVGVSLYCCMKKKRGQTNFKEKKEETHQIQTEQVKRFPVFDNIGFESDVNMDTAVVDEQVYMCELEKLRLQDKTLLHLLNQVRQRVRAMEPRDTRIPTYKGVIHQLCRVLGLLNRKNPMISIPSDALGLLEWAQQMLNDFYELQQQEAIAPSEECRTTDISYPTTEPIYAIPPQAKTTLSKQSNSGYYSSVPVPIESYVSGHKRSTPMPIMGKGPLKKLQNSTSQLGLNSNSDISQVGFISKNQSEGYFYNGRYYDPSPKPKIIYAPGSAYSERSGKCLSTFMNDDAQSSTISDYSGDCEELEQELSIHDGLPFDPKDATDPVEV